MNVLLIVSPYYYPHSQAVRTELLGLLYLASNLCLEGYNVSILDTTIDKPMKMEDGSYYYGISRNELRRKITQNNPDVVGISCHYAYSHNEAYKLASLIKEINPGIITLLGGVFASIYQEKILYECQSLDYVLLGESERTLPQ